MGEFISAWAETSAQSIAQILSNPANQHVLDQLESAPQGVIDVFTIRVMLRMLQEIQQGYSAEDVQSAQELLLAIQNDESQPQQPASSSSPSGSGESQPQQSNLSSSSSMSQPLHPQSSSSSKAGSSVWRLFSGVGIPLGR